MSLFCKKCAEKFGMIPDKPPFLCEGCGQEFVKKEPIMKVVYKRFNRWIINCFNVVF